MGFIDEDAILQALKQSGGKNESTLERLLWKNSLLLEQESNQLKREKEVKRDPAAKRCEKR